MFCPKCGTENPDGIQMCKSCNAVLTGTPTSTAVSSVKTSGWAIAALICGILTPFTCITGILAIIFGIIALVKIGKSAGILAGKGLAIAGICVSAVFLLISAALCAYLMFIELPNKIEQARANTTMANLKTLHVAVNQFYMDTGRYPTEEESLNALIEQPADVTNWNPGGYLETKGLPKDGWNRDFIYEPPDSGRHFVIRSAGPDGEAGTVDDLLSTDTYSQWHR